MPELQTTVQQALRRYQQQLSDSSTSPKLEVEILLAHTLQCSRTCLRTWPEKLLTTQQLAEMEEFIKRRSNGEPIAYITGEREFWSMTLQVSPDTLIPRPETETLVEVALEKIPTDAAWRIADLGTGSGAIALAIARERPQCQLVATDISAEALSIAQGNAQRFNISNIRFVKGYWYEPLANEQFEMIVSNPPYIHPGDPHLQQGDLRFEPLSALQSEIEGLADIRRICTDARHHLLSSGWLVLEHGYDQGTSVPAMLHTLKYQQIQTVKDLAQNDRVSLGIWAN